MFNITFDYIYIYKLNEMMKVSKIIVTQTSILIKIHYEIDISRRKRAE